MDHAFPRPKMAAVAAVRQLLITTALLVPFLAAPVAAQDETHDMPEANASLRVVHASPDAGNVDVLLDGRPFAENLAFGNATVYAPVEPGEHTVQVLPTGQSGADPLDEEPVEVDEGQAYIVTALGTLDELDLKANRVRLDALEPGTARLRIIHAAADAGKVDLSLAGGDSLAEGLNFKDDSEYVELGAGNYDIAIHADTGDLTVPGLRIDSGRVYDVIALGQLGNRSLTLLPLATSVSRPCGEILGVGGAGDACVRVIHAHPDVPALDFTIAGNAIAQEVVFGQASGFVAVPAAAGAAIVASPVDGQAVAAPAATTFDLAAGQAYEAIAWTDADDADAAAGAGILIGLKEVDLTPLPDGQARLRVIHAAGDVGTVDVAVADGPLLFPGVEEGKAVPYVVVDAGAATLRVAHGGGGDAIAESPVTIEPGAVYDAIALGRVEGGTFALLLLAAPAEIRAAEDALPATAT